MKKVLALILIAVAAMVMLYVGMPVIAYGFWGLSKVGVSNLLSGMIFYLKGMRTMIGYRSQQLLYLR